MVKKLLAMCVVVCGLALAQVVWAAPNTEAECKAQGGTCYPTNPGCAGYSLINIGQCDVFATPFCCGKASADGKGTSAAEKMAKEACQKNPQIAGCDKVLGAAGQAAVSAANQEAAKAACQQNPELPGCNLTKGEVGKTGTVTVGSPITLQDPLKGKGVYGIMQNLISIFFGFAGAIALLVFVYSGVIYLTAGTSDRVKEAMNAMKYAILGLIIIIFAYSISGFLINGLTASNEKAVTPVGQKAQLLQ